MDVLPAVAATETMTAVTTRVRLAYYLRPRDISNRYIADHRLVVATMHTDVIPAEYVRGSCTVRHRDSIHDIDAYKRERDAFYFHQVRDCDRRPVPPRQLTRLLSSAQLSSSTTATSTGTLMQSRRTRYRTRPVRRARARSPRPWRIA